MGSLAPLPPPALASDAEPRATACPAELLRPDDPALYTPQVVSTPILVRKPPPGWPPDGEPRPPPASASSGASPAASIPELGGSPVRSHSCAPCRASLSGVAPTSGGTRSSRSVASPPRKMCKQQAVGGSPELPDRGLRAVSRLVSELAREATDGTFRRSIRGFRPLIREFAGDDADEELGT
ncbi:hypothetical protein AB1Y20_020415 [Prymnesium parvum]|uniref:Uncharacterized protein n=1 Tax=Prymnesium parvum TaxID=97485 RepID=A0AB34JV75_PRYPA